jgi:hypothetical protein
MEQPDLPIPESGLPAKIAARTVTFPFGIQFYPQGGLRVTFVMHG